MNAFRCFPSLSSWKILVLFMGSSPTGAWLGAGRAASASTCAAASVAHQLGQPDENCPLFKEGASKPSREGIAVVVYHHTSKCKYSDTQVSVS